MNAEAVRCQLNSVTHGALSRGTCRAGKRIVSSSEELVIEVRRNKTCADKIHSRRRKRIPLLSLHAVNQPQDIRAPVLSDCGPTSIFVPSLLPGIRGPAGGRFLKHAAGSGVMET